jgi:hypothetical protein
MPQYPPARFMPAAAKGAIMQLVPRWPVARPGMRGIELEPRGKLFARTPVRWASQRAQTAQAGQDASCRMQFFYPSHAPSASHGPRDSNGAHALRMYNLRGGAGDIGNGRAPWPLRCSASSAHGCLTRSWALGIEMKVLRRRKNHTQEPHIAGPPNT